MTRPFPVTAGTATVANVEDVTPRMRRITIADEGLRRLPVEEPGEIITLLWPEEGKPLVLPEEGWRFPAGVAERQHARNYTVRSWEPGSDEVVIDFVVHGDHGRASRWAAAAAPGHEIGYAGSRLHWLPVATEGWALLVGDETGLPALSAIAEDLPAGMRAIALVEVEDEAERQPIDTAAELEVRWLHRDGAQAGQNTLLVDAVRELDLPEGQGRAWGGGEALAMRDVRRHLKDERGLPGEDTQVLGYWKHRTTKSWE